MTKGNPIKIRLKAKLKNALLKILRFPKTRKAFNSKKFEVQGKSESFEDWFPNENF